MSTLYVGQTLRPQFAPGLTEGSHQAFPEKPNKGSGYANVVLLLLCNLEDPWDRDVNLAYVTEQAQIGVDMTLDIFAWIPRKQNANKFPPSVNVLV